GNPVWAEGTMSDTTYLFDMTTDKQGNLLMTGIFKSDSMKIGPFTLTNPYGIGTYQYFVAKVSPSGTVLWAVNDGNVGPYILGGTGGAEIAQLIKKGGIATDDSGNVYIT